MALNRPQQKESIAQTLYTIAARTGIELNLDRLWPTLSSASLEGDVPNAEVVTLTLQIATVSSEGLKDDARRVREIADLIEAAADKPRGGR